MSVTLLGEGFDRCPNAPQFYFHRQMRVLIEAHMDDFYGGGRLCVLPRVLLMLRTQFKLKDSDVIVDGRYAHLKRDRLRRGRQILLRPNAKHIDTILSLLGLEKANPTRTPSAQGEKEVEGDDAPLDKDQASIYRSCTGSGVYLSHDRVDVAKEIGQLASAL